MLLLTSEKILQLWASFNKAPFGKELFSKALAFMIPYTGSMKATVIKLEAGATEVELKEHRGVRNHLNSVHAVALMNLGELSTGLSCLTSLPPKSRGILKLKFNSDRQYPCSSTKVAGCR